MLLLLPLRGRCPCGSEKDGNKRERREADVDGSSGTIPCRDVVMYRTEPTRLRNAHIHPTQRKPNRTERRDRSGKKWGKEKERQRTRYITTNLILAEKLPTSAASINEYTTPGCTVMCRTAAVGDGPARRASSVHTRSVWNFVPSYGRSLCMSCQSSASNASAYDPSDDIHTTRAGPKPDRVWDAASFASSARHCSRERVSTPEEGEWRRTHDDIVPEHVALPHPPEPVIA